MRKDMQFYAFGFNMKKNILIKKRKWRFCEDFKRRFL